MEANRPRRRIPRIDLAKAREAHDIPRGPVFADVRSRFAYDEAHVLNAVSLPVSSIESQSDALSPDQEIIVYGDGPDDDTAVEAAAFLIGKGFKKVSILNGGFDGWDDAGYPVGRELPREEAVQIHSEFKEGPS